MVHGLPITYAGLTVIDATGTVLSSRLRQIERSVVLEIDDAGATYPIIVDPVIALAATLVPDGSPTRSPDWGTASAMDGNHLFIGEPDATDSGYIQGRTHQYSWNGAGWTFVRTIRIAATDSDAAFGSSLAVHGDWLVAGAPGMGAKGTVYAIRLSGGFNANGVPNVRRALVPPETGIDNFGISVSISGNRLAAGTGSSYRAYVYNRSGDDWTTGTAHKLVGSGFFGRSVALDRQNPNLLVVGAPVQSPRGAVYVYQWNGSSWGSGTAIAAPYSDETAFGVSVAVDGDRFAVGTLAYNGSRGELVRYGRSGSNWQLLSTFVSTGILSATSQPFSYDHPDRAPHVAFARDPLGASNDIMILGLPNGYETSGDSGAPQGTVDVRPSSISAAARTTFGPVLTSSRHRGRSVVTDGRRVVLGYRAPTGCNPFCSGFRAVAASHDLQRENGDPCTAADQCLSGHCVDGVCCNTACGGGATDDCMACHLYGESSGTCTALNPNSAPNVTCRGAQGPCDIEERCQVGSMACPVDQVQPSSFECRAGLGPCPAETCDGASGQCGTTCRASATPEGWLALCNGGAIGPAFDSLCAALQGLDLEDPSDAVVAEGLALGMNVLAGDAGVFPPAFGSLHFSHGRYAGYTVEQVNAAVDPWSLGSQPELLELAIAANRAFVGGHDSGALAEWVTTPVCSAEGVPAGDRLEVEGPASARCAMLDEACTRGRYLAAGECCTFELQPAGTRCGNQQVCTQDGRCVDPSLVEGVPDFEAERVRGPLTWVDVLSEGNPFAWRLPGGDRLRVSVVSDGEQVPVDPPPADPEQWVSRSGARFGRPVAGVTADAEEGRVRVGRSTGPIPAVAVEAGAFVRALYVPGVPSELCVIRNRSLDDLGPVMSDCSTPGADRLPCPGELEDGALSCEHEERAGESFAVVRGEGLAMAFAMLPTALPLWDVWPLIFEERVCTGFGCARTLDGHLPTYEIDGIPDLQGSLRVPGIGPHPAMPCQLADQCYGFRLCLSFRGASQCGVCIPRMERCNGVDDDCDGTVDEGGDATCDDGIACTRHACVAGSCTAGNAGQGYAFCTNAYCAVGICNGEEYGPVIRPGMRRDANVDQNGCSFAFDDDVCESVFDQCECNGVSMCDPTAAEGEGTLAELTGCSALSPLATPRIGLPCEWGAGGDRNLCTPEMCCEPNSNCRYFRAPASPPFVRLETTIIVPSSDAVCQQPGATEQRFGSTGQHAQCVRYHAALSLADRVAWGCNDGDPCTYGVCTDPWTGHCRQDPRLGVAEPRTIQPTIEGIAVGDPIPLDGGCTGNGDGDAWGLPALLNRGCATRRCEWVDTYQTRTACQIRATPGGPYRYDCRGDDAGSGDYDDCGHRECVGVSCVETNVDERCDDGLACTQDLCILGYCPTLNPPPGSVPPPLHADFCFIGGACVTNGTKRTAHPGECYQCDSGVNPYGWSLEDRPDCLE